MPAKSEAQRRLFAIAEYNPSALYKKNKGLSKLSHKTLHDFASTKGIRRKTDGGFYGHYNPNAMKTTKIRSTGGLHQRSLSSRLKMAMPKVKFGGMK